VTGRTLDRVFFGWKVVAAAFAVAVFSWGIGFYGPSVFLHVLHSQRGWPVSAISAAITAHYLVSAAIVVRLPELHRRFGMAAMTRAATGTHRHRALGLGFCGGAMAALRGGNPDRRGFCGHQRGGDYRDGVAGAEPSR
jgi:hypothetical protein